MSPTPGHSDCAIEIGTRHARGGDVLNSLAVFDVGAYAMSREADDKFHPLPCSEAAGGHGTVPIIDSSSMTMLTFFSAGDTDSRWHRAVVVGIVSNPLVDEAHGGVAVRRVMYVAKLATDSLSMTFPQPGDSGTPFFDPNGHLHSFLFGTMEGPGQPASLRLLLVPANAALAQLRALPELRDYGIRRFVAPSTVQERNDTMRAAFRVPVSTLVAGAILAIAYTLILGRAPAAAQGVPPGPALDEAAAARKPEDELLLPSTPRGDASDGDVDGGIGSGGAGVDKKKW